MKNKSGVTLVEALIIMAIVGMVLFIIFGQLRDRKTAETDNGQTYQYQTISIEGCQYIILSDSITHKGNCTNSIHKFNQ